jgi:hypothetical protein
MRIEPPIELYPRRRNPIAAFFVFLLWASVVGMAVYVILLCIPVSQPSYVLTDAEGAEIYRNKAWKPLKSGDSIEGGDRIRAYKIGWADLSSSEIALKLIGGSEMNISKFYIWTRKPKIELEKGYVYAVTENSELVISAGALATNSFTFPLLSFFDVTIAPKSKIAVGLSPANGHARVYAVENSAAIQTWIPKQLTSLEEGKSSEIFMQPFSLRTAAVEPAEAVRLAESFKKINLVKKPAKKEMPSAPKDEAPAAKPAPEVPAASQETVKSSFKDSPWNLDSPSLFKTKSSEAEWTKGHFEYNVPNPESIAGVIFKAQKEIDASQFKTLKIQITPVEGLGFPETLRIEMKSEEKILRVFTAKLKGSAEELQFPVRFSATTPVTEISLLVTHAKAGTSKKGGFQVSGLSFS